MWLFDGNVSSVSPQYFLLWQLSFLPVSSIMSTPLGLLMLCRQQNSIYCRKLRYDNFQLAADTTTRFTHKCNICSTAVAHLVRTVYMGSHRCVCFAARPPLLFFTHIFYPKPLITLKQSRGIYWKMFIFIQFGKCRWIDHRSSLWTFYSIKSN